MGETSQKEKKIIQNIVCCLIYELIPSKKKHISTKEVSVLFLVF